MASKTLMNIRWGGEMVLFDIFAASTDELREIKRKMGMPVAVFMRGVTELDVDAMLALKWLVERAAGHHDLVCPTPNTHFPDYWAFVNAWQEADQAVEAEPDPTEAGSLPAGSTLTSNGSSTPTSTTSPTDTESVSPGGSESANGRSDSSLTEASSPTATPWT